MNVGYFPPQQAATYLHTVGGGRVLLQDESGERFHLPLSKVFGTQEALEASIANLRISVDPIRQDYRVPSVTPPLECPAAVRVETRALKEAWLKDHNVDSWVDQNVYMKGHQR
jgi:hypothetical protein